MTANLLEIEVQSIIEFWKHCNVCPIIDGRMDYLEDHPLNASIWSEKGGKFIYEHFGQSVTTGFSDRLSPQEEALFVVYAFENSAVWDELVSYAQKLTENEEHLGGLMLHMVSLFLKGDDPHDRRGAAEQGRYDDKFKWRNSLIAITVDIWKEKKYPITRANETVGRAPFTILELIHEALKRVRPNDRYVPNVSHLKKIYYKTRS